MDLESDKRLNIQLRLDFSTPPTGEARQAERVRDMKSPPAVNEPERPADKVRIMEEVCEQRGEFEGSTAAGEGQQR